MDKKERIRPLTLKEQRFASEHYHLINGFMKRTQLDIEEYFNVVILEYLLAVQKYMENIVLQQNYNFDSVVYMYMKRAVSRHFKAQKAMKRCSGYGNDISYEEVDFYITAENNDINSISTLEYDELMNQIMQQLTAEQQTIFYGKLEGYSLKDIAENNGINTKRVYKQFAKIKTVVAEVCGISIYKKGRLKNV